MGAIEYARKSGGDIYNLADPKVRRLLFERIGALHDISALELLWFCYFSNMWENDFNPEECRMMQGLVGEYAIKILMYGGEKAKAVISMMLGYEESPLIEVLELLLRWLGELRFRKDQECRRLASAALLKFLPQHRDFHELGLVIAYVNSASDAEDDPDISGNIQRLLTAVKLRYEHDRELSEPE